MEAADVAGRALRTHVASGVRSGEVDLRLIAATGSQQVWRRSDQMYFVLDGELRVSQWGDCTDGGEPECVGFEWVARGIAGVTERAEMARLELEPIYWLGRLGLVAHVEHSWWWADESVDPGVPPEPSWSSTVAGPGVSLALFGAQQSGRFDLTA